MNNISCSVDRQLQQLRKCNVSKLYDAQQLGFYQFTVTHGRPASQH